MTDRELLELAAKAAGIGVNCLGDEPADWYRFDLDHKVLWNPLLRDGDALRLAIMLDIVPRRINGASFAWCDSVCDMVEHGEDPYAATRRAIVRAAAAIGKARTQ